MAAIIDNKEARLEDVFPFLGVRQKNLPDVCYPLKVAPSQLMLPPIPHMHRHWTSFGSMILSGPTPPNQT